MNKPKRIEEILTRLGSEEIPDNVEETAGRIVEDFRRELEQEGGRYEHRQRTSWMVPMRWFGRLAAAAVVFFAFFIGMGVGRWSKPEQSQARGQERPVKIVQIAKAAVDEKEGFWRAKAIASLRTKPYKGPKTYRKDIGLWESYGKYMKEKYYE